MLAVVLSTPGQSMNQSYPSDGNVGTIENVSAHFSNQTDSTGIDTYFGQITDSFSLEATHSTSVSLTYEIVYQYESFPIVNSSYNFYHVRASFEQDNKYVRVTLGDINFALDGKSFVQEIDIFNTQFNVGDKHIITGKLVGKSFSGYTVEYSRERIPYGYLIG